MPSGKKARLRKIASGLVFWTGLALIGLIAIPAGILFAMIVLIWEALSFILKKIDREHPGNVKR